MPRPQPQSTLLLGIDVGSTLVKAVVFDRTGVTRGSAVRGVPVERPHPGWVERDATAVWRAVGATIRQATRGAGPVAAVGLTGCGNGAVFVDRALRPLRPGVLSSDRRAAGYLERRPHERFTAYPGQTAPLLRWLRAEQPALAARLAHVLPWKDFVRARLTDEVATDPTDAGAAGWLAPGTRRAAEPARDPAIPPLRESLAPAGAVTAVAARATGLRVGTPVFMGCIDCEAAAIGSGLGDDGTLSVVAGTWSVNQRFTPRQPRRRDLFLVNPSAQPGRWLVLEGSPTSAANLDWAVRLLGLRDIGEALTLIARARRTRALFIPRVPEGAGVFVGLDAAHGPAEVLRTVLEGIAFGHRSHLARLIGPRAAPERVRLAGGIARSDVVAQVFADVFGCTVEVPAGEELGALGAALVAGTGAGVWPSLAAAQRDSTRVARTFSPRPAAVAELAADYARYRRLAGTAFVP